MEKLKADFAELKKGYAKLQKLEGNSGNNDAYYAERAIFVEALRKFLYHDFTELNKENILWLCDRVSTFRPVAPFSFLVSISNRKSRKKLI
jgi:hypothetical protein